MAYRKLTRPCWIAVCDVCGEHYGGEDGGSAHFSSKKEMLERMDRGEADAGWERRDGKLVCESCIGTKGVWDGKMYRYPRYQPEPEACPPRSPSE